MALYFRTLRSSSKANCVALWNENTCVLFDCGFSSMKQCRLAINQAFGSMDSVDAVVLSHNHTDHINYYALRVIESHSYGLYVYSDALDQLRQRHFRTYGFSGLDINTYTQNGFSIGDFRIVPFELTHQPAFRTFGFRITVNVSGRQVVVVLATDFYDLNENDEIFNDADFIYIESNHDLELLRKYFNPNSRYHMSNPKTADFLTRYRRSSSKPPVAVMLGHLSEQRNTAQIAMQETKNSFEKSEVDLDFNLLVAPAVKLSDVVLIAE